jgi:nucleoid-associated protein YgaU
MRKEVKLGMAIGGGVVALLIVYLLVAPPSGGKKGAQFVSAGGNGNGDLAAGAVENNSNNTIVDPALVNGNAMIEAQLRKGAAEQGAKATETANGSPARDPWKPQLDKGTGNVNGNASKPQQSPGSQNPVAGAKQKDVSVATGGQQQQGQAGKNVEVASSSGNARSQAHLYFDPNAAWGGGVSTDAAAPGVTRSAVRTPAKTNLISEPKSKGAELVVEPAAAGGKSNTHVVRPGETFSSIAMAAYGSSAYYPHILRANPGLTPTNLKVGSTINLPAVEEVKASHVAAEKAAAEKAAGEKSAGEVPAGPRMVEDVKIDPTRQYRVVTGDSLYKIGLKLYRNGQMGERIYEANRATIGSDPKRLKLGMILQLPEPPASAAGAATGERAATPVGTGTGDRTTSGTLDDARNNGATASEPFLGNESDPK